MVTALKKVTRKRMKKVLRWSNQNGALVSFSKTEYMVFGSGDFGKVNIKLDNRTVKINWTELFKYLGYEIDNKLSGSQHITSRINKTKKLMPLLRKKSNQFSIERRTQAVQSMLYPILTYGWETIGNLAKSAELNRWNNVTFLLQKLCLKTYTSSYKNVTSVCKLPTLRDYMDKQLAKNTCKIVENKLPRNHLLLKQVFELPKSSRTGALKLTGLHPRVQHLQQQHFNHCKIQKNRHGQKLQREPGFQA
jgi:hypothetical protein